MGPLKNRSQKFIFLLVVIVAAIAARAWYVGLSAVPGTAADLSRNGTTTSADANAPATSSLRSSLMSTDIVIFVASAPTSVVQEPYFGEADTAQSVFVRAARTAVPLFSKEALLVEDLTNGVNLAAVNADARWPTASLTKLMTATVAVDHLSLDTRITITPQMFAVDPNEHTLVANGTYTVSDLLHVMLMPSSNVAAEALADYYGHGQFMAVMNARAAEWGMTDTYFDDPSGLSAANESSAHDLATLAAHVYRDYPAILSYTDTPSIVITELESGTRVNVDSINQFAGDANFIGGKTGYIPQAGNNLLSIFRYKGRPVLIIVLGAADAAQRFGDTTKLLNWFTMNYH